MNRKDFFKPTVGKLFLTFVLLIAVGNIAVTCNYPDVGNTCYRVTGFPLDFSRVVEDHSYDVPGEFGLVQPYKTEAIPLNIVIDIIFWYIIAIFISYLTKKIIIKFNLEKYKKPTIVVLGIMMFAIPLLTRSEKYVEFNQFMLSTGFVLSIFSLINFLHIRLWKKIFWTILINIGILIIFFSYLLDKND